MQSFTYSSTIEPAPMVIRAVPRFWIACNRKSVKQSQKMDMLSRGPSEKIFTQIFWVT